MPQRNLSLAKTEQQEAREALSKQQQAATAASRELEEAKAKARKEVDELSAEVKTLKVFLQSWECLSLLDTVTVSPCYWQSTI